MYSSSPALLRYIKSVIILLVWSLSHTSVQASDKDSVRVSLLTCSAGADVYELCGHAALRIQNGKAADDYVVNYGLFDFDSPNFLYRFVVGQTDYKVGAQPTAVFLHSYYRHGRSVTEYELNLTPDQKEELERLLLINLQPENSTYRYNYVKDNCATRPLAIIEQAIGDTIIFTGEPITSSGWSFRDEMKWFHRNYPWYQFGIDLALGSGIDYKLTTREKCFAPLMIDSLITYAVISDSVGMIHPLAKQVTLLVPEVDGGVMKGPTPWYLTPVFVFWILFAIVLVISVYNIWKRTETRWLDTLIYSVYGIAGCVIVFLILYSEHEATSPNWLAIGINPFCFIAAILPWISNLKKLLYYYHTANFIILFILVCTWPFTGQTANPAFLPLLLIDMVRSDTYRMIWKCKKANSHIIPQK